MRAAILILALLVLVSVGSAQNTYVVSNVVDRAGTTMTNYKYASGKTDTSLAYSPLGWNDVTLLIKTRDSLSLTVYYMPSFDGVTFSPRVIIDSISVDVADVKAIQLPQAALAYPRFKWAWTINVYREGFTNDTLDFKMYKRE